MFLNGDLIHRSDNNYVLAPYTDRCMKYDLDSLVRRRINAIVLFVHAIIQRKINSNCLRSQINIYDGIRSLRNPEFIRVKSYKTDHSQYSPFNKACYIFNHAALFIDPSLSFHEFKEKLLRLPDSAFGPWTKL